MSKSKSKIQDVVSGEILGVRPEIYASRIEEYGDEETLRRTYVGRKSKQALRGGQTVEQIRATVGATGELPEITAETLSEIMTRISPKKSTKKSKTRTPKVAKTTEPEDEVDEDIRDFMAVGKLEPASATV
jgi:hypothetical protein